MKKALLILGGSWHDFEGFADWFTDFLSQKHWKVEATYDLDRLLALEKEKIDLVVSYTCFSANPDTENQKGSGKMTDEQVIALYSWVRSGGAFYSVHGATILGETNPLYVKLNGGKFVKHPPAHTFTVYPLYGNHEIIEGIDAFQVTDELYIEDYEGTLDILMVSILEDVVHPIVWCKHEGLGRVVHNALGHTPEVWSAPAYQMLTSNAINWLLAWIQ